MRMNIKNRKIRKVIKKKRNKKRIILNQNITKQIYLKVLIFFIFSFTLLKKKIQEPNNNVEVYMNEDNFFENKLNNTYFSCFVAKGKMENRYVRELVDHYLSIGVEKFYFGDDNSLDGEKLSDVLQDYIDRKIVKIKDIRGKRVSQMEFYEYSLNKLYYKCKWLIFFDFDEFLEFIDKNMTIQKYLSLEIFNKCDVIKIHWLMYYDNDLVHYDNRTLRERFPNPNKKSFENRFHKSIVRGRKYNGTMWNNATGPHQPNESLAYVCNNEGKFLKHKPRILENPNYKYCYIKHYSMKTVEEFVMKLIRGGHMGQEYNYKTKLDRINRFFKYNTFTEEKLSIIEKMTNMTSLNITKIIKNNSFHHK